MNDQQLDNLIAYLHSIEITPEAAQEQAAERAEAELARLQEQEGEEGAQSATIGAALFNDNCARCHTLGWSYDEPQRPGGGAMGPSLYNATNQFPDREDHIGFVSEGAENGERYGLNGQSNGRMPYFSQVLTADQIASIVEYERLLNEREDGRPEEIAGGEEDDRGNAQEEVGAGGEDAEEDGGPSSSQSGQSETSELDDGEGDGGAEGGSGGETGGTGATSGEGDQ